MRIASRSSEVSWAFASNGQTVHYDEIRRLCRLSQEQLGAYLEEARRAMVDAGQPDFCSIVSVKQAGRATDGQRGRTALIRASGLALCDWLTSTGAIDASSTTPSFGRSTVSFPRSQGSSR